MAVIIGSARGDERGKAHGGKAGDQTGQELSTQNWYLHKKGWVVLRPKSPEAAKNIAKAMRAACANRNIGYDQYQRLTLYNACKPLGFDPGKVVTACETDCSALVRVCCAYAGITAGNFTTDNQVRVLMATGAFEKLTDAAHTKSASRLVAGDILVTKTKGHTAVVLTDGSKCDRKDTGTRPTIRKGSCGDFVKLAQVLLTGQGFKLPRYGADGDFGAETDKAVRAYQSARGLEVDGIVGKITWGQLEEDDK